MIYAVVAVLFVGPALLPGKTLSNSDTLWFEPPWIGVKPPELSRPSNPELGDGPRYLQPFLRETVRQMPHVPLWNPNIVAGRPFQANSQSAVFGPYTLPAYVLPFWTALSWIAVLKLWVAAFGTFLLGRSLGMRFGGAVLAGIVFALNLKLVTWLSYPAMSVWTFIPWLLFLTDRLIRRPDLLAGAGLAAVVAIQFLSGHAESSLHALIPTGAFFALRLWQARRAGASAVQRLGRPVLAFGAAIAGGAALAAVSLVPFAELLWLSADLPDRRGFSVDLHLPAEDALGIFLPDYWGRPTQTPIRPLLLERAMYVGALPLMLAACALILRPTVERVWVALFGGLWFAVVMGIPPFLQMVTRLPIFNSGHNTRLIVLTLLAVSLLAGWGLDDLASSRVATRLRSRFALAVAAVLFLTPLVIVLVGQRFTLGVAREALQAAWLFVEPPITFATPAEEAAVRLSSLIAWLTLAGAGLFLLVRRFQLRIGPWLFVLLALLLVCADLFRAGMGYNPAIDREWASVPATGAIGLLQRQGFARFASTEEIPQNVIAMRYGLYEAGGYDLPIVRRFDRLWRQEVSPESPSVARGLLDIPLDLRKVTPRAARVLRLLGVTHVLRGTTGRAATPPYRPISAYRPLRNPDLTEVYSGPDARVYRLNGALPRTWVVNAHRAVGDGAAALDAITRPAFDPRRVAVTERRLPGLPEGEAAPSTGRAQIVRYEAERVVVQARTGAAGIVVLSDTDFPGWKAKVDGRDTPVERVDYVLRGVRVDPGVHTIEFYYQPLSWQIGWMISAVSVLGLGLAIVVGRRRRRRASVSAGLVPSPDGRRQGRLAAR